ncbi:MAG: protein kinase [Myxococcales bacterium]|nr:protein kinase [Myxococcales bacterium]
MSRLAASCGALAGGRFELSERLGSGSFGDVYQAYDHEEAQLVALKLLHRADPLSIARFKKEFRAVADVHHDNLVRLYGLFRDGDRFFFTMELVPGPDVVSWVRPGGRLEWGRFAPTFAQLAAALAALHASGHVHRDVKPSNVRVHDGRVVLLDFGLSLALDEGSMSDGLVGSPRYMAPEQTEGRRATPASDAYGLGAVMYEAVCGHPPFEGRPLDVLVRKRLEPAPPLQVDDAVEISSDLEAVVADLLDRAPERRPRLEALATLLEGGALETGVGHAEDVGEPAVWVGREPELARLRDAWAAQRRGQATTLWLEGEPGVGKTALVRRFLTELPADVWVLAGRCFEQESVPYEGLDAAVDRLASYLRAQPDVLDGFEGTGIPSLLTLFPVLGQVSHFGAMVRPVGYERAQLRVEAFDALHQLLNHVASRRPMVLVIDDLQWVDRDGAALLAELLRGPDGIPMVFLGVLRASTFERAPWVMAVRALGGESMTIDALTSADARALARALGGAQWEASSRVIEAAEGNPFLIEMLVRHGAGASDLRDAVSRLLDGLLPESRRLLDVVCLAGSPISRATALEVADVSRGADRALSELRADHLITLQLRGRDADERPGRVLLEPYHDRIREAVVARLDASARRTLHRRLAGSLVAIGAEPELIAHHYDRAEEVALAIDWMVRAARRAESALAWEAAARLYLRAIQRWESMDAPVEVTIEALRAGETSSPNRSAANFVGHPTGRRAASGPTVGSWEGAPRGFTPLGGGAGDSPSKKLTRGRLEVALGDALGHAGRGIDAATAFRRALDEVHATPDVEIDPLELRRRVAEQLLRCGRMEEGVAALDEALIQVGLRYPRRIELALTSLLAGRAKLWLRGIRFEPRQQREIAHATLQRIDLCWSAGIGLGFVDSIRGASFLTRSLLEALDAGDPYRIARSMAYEASYQANQGVSGEPRARALISATAAIARELEDPHLRALVSGAKCLVEFHTGRWRKAQEQADDAVGAFREHSVGMVKEIATIQLLGTTALTFLGELGELERRHGAMLRSAESRGDLFSITCFRTGFLNAGWLAADEPERAKAEAELAMREWRIEGYVIQSFFDLWARSQIELYQGDAVAAAARVRAGWGAFRRSLLTRLQFLRVAGHELAGRAALASGDLRAAKGHEKALRKENVAWALASAIALEAGRLHRMGRATEAEASYAEAAVRFAALDMRSHVAAATIARGRVSRGSRGDDLVNEGERALGALGIRAPLRWAGMLCPSIVPPR